MIDVLRAFVICEESRSLGRYARQHAGMPAGGPFMCVQKLFDFASSAKSLRHARS